MHAPCPRPPADLRTPATPVTGHPAGGKPGGRAPSPLHRLRRRGARITQPQAPTPIFQPMRPR